MSDAEDEEGFDPSDEELPVPSTDGFRPRKVRQPGWLDSAIADGSVRDPTLPPEEHATYPPSTFVVAPPVATASSKE